jgi:hypothetical protein
VRLIDLRAERLDKNLEEIFIDEVEKEGGGQR